MAKGDYKKNLLSKIDGEKKANSRQVILPNGATLYSKTELKKLGKADSNKIKPQSKKEAEKTETRWIKSSVLGVQKKKRRTFVPPTLRKSITPGTVLIVLAGQHAGKRVVFLGQMPSGLLLVTGPFKMNGVPLKRIDQKLVIATSTKVDASGLSVPEGLTEDLFKKTRVNPRKKEFLSTEQTKEGSTNKAKKELSPKEKENLEKRKQFQETVDNAVIAAIEKVDYLSGYLKTPFTLERGQYPHDMKF